MAWRRGTARRGPTYRRMLGGIVVFYAVIIGLSDSMTGPGRILVLGYLLWISLRLRGPAGLRPWVWVGTAVALIVAGWFNLVGETVASSAIVGALSFLIICVLIGTIATTLTSLGRVDTETVLGVLSIYLLLALLFSSLNQFFAAFDPHYLNGVSGPPTASDLLYFSVITIATVGYGDITPVSEIARAVSVIEALAGQLYLVSVVAAVVGGWRAAKPTQNGPDETNTDDHDGE